MIRTLFFTRIKTDARRLKEPKSAIAAIFFVAFAWFYAWGFAQIGKGLNDTDGLSLYISIENMVLASIFSIVILRMVLPSYQPLQRLFPAYYPISKWQSYHASIVNELYRVHGVFILLFLIIHVVYSGNLTFLSLSLIVYCCATFLRRSMQYLFDFRLKRGAYISTSIIYAMAPVMLIIDKDFYRIWYWQLAITILIYLNGYYQHLSIVNPKQTKGSGLKLSETLKLLLNNQKARNPLIYGLVIKTAFLWVDYYLLKSSGNHLLDDKFIYWLFASPVLVFTYVFNNIWAYWPALWLNIELRNGRYPTMMWRSIKLMLIPLLLDVLVTMPILLFTRDDYGFSIPFYLTLLVFLPLQSLMWSLFTAKNIKSKVGSKKRASFWSSITSIISVALLLTLSINYWFYILIPFYLLAGYISFYQSKSMYREKKYALAQTLLKE